MPFGDDSFNTTSGNLRYLNVPQVMEDYVALLTYLKEQDTTLQNKATIVFGGSYGGMLAAWLRMKYPSMFQGALASSAPVLWFNGTITNTAYTQVASRVIKQQGGDECYDMYSKGFYDLTNMKYDQSKYAQIQ
jgi:lysosomal Pro-X carboxypeptidase